MSNPRIVELSEWKTPATAYPLARVGNARLVRSNYPKGVYPSYGVDGADYYQVLKPIPVTSLQRLHRRAWKTWMVDDPPHWWAMQNYAAKSKGRVAVAGLGLGLVTHALLSNPAVRHVDVVEIDQDVNELMLPNLPIKLPNPRFGIIEEDAGAFLTRKKEGKYDRIILDLWVASGKEEVERVLWSEVVPFTRAVRLAHPESSIVVHGFAGIPETLADITARTMDGLKLP